MDPLLQMLTRINSKGIKRMGTQQKQHPSIMVSCNFVTVDIAFACVMVTLLNSLDCGNLLQTVSPCHKPSDFPL